MDIRLIAYEPFGNRLGILPKAISTQIVTTIIDLPTLTISYPKDQTNYAILGSQVEVAFEYHNGNAWVEPYNARFMMIKSDDDVVDEIRIKDFSFIGIGWLLRRARVWDGRVNVDADGKQQFDDQTPGSIMMTLINDAKGRGWGSGINLGFTPTADSAGNPWNKRYTIAYEPSLDLETVLSNLAEQGACDFAWDGRTLHIWNAESEAGISRNLRDIRLLNSDSVTSSPETSSYENLISHIKVFGDGVSWDYTNNANHVWGRLEGATAHGGVTKEATAASMIELDLEKGKVPIRSHTKEFAGQSRVEPFKDFRIGDWLTVQTDSGMEAMKVNSLSLTVDNEFRWFVSLGDKLSDILSRIAKRTTGIVNGTSSDSTGGLPSYDDKRTPSTPTGFIVDSFSQVSGTGEIQGILNFVWNDDLKAVDGTAQDRTGYEIQWQQPGTVNLWSRLNVFDAADTNGAYGPVPVYKEDGTLHTYTFRLRTLGPNKNSAWTTPVVETMEGDNEPPPVPSTPVVEVVRSVFTAVWDGLGSAGENMPPDFSHIIIEMSDTATGPWVEIGTLTGLSGYTVANQGYVTRFFRFKAVDRIGNTSAPTGVASGTAVPLVETEDLAQAFRDLDLAVQVAQASANGKNTVWKQATEPVLQEGQSHTEGDIWWVQSAIGAPITAQRYWDGTQWVTDELGHQVIASVDLGKATIGELDGYYIKANTILANAMAIGDFTSLAPSIAAQRESWRLEGGAANVFWAASDDKEAVRLYDSGTPEMFGPFRETKPGDKWRASVIVESYGGTTQNTQLRIYWYDKDRIPLSNTFLASTLGIGGDGLLAGEAEAPANAVFAVFYLYSTGTGGSGGWDLAYNMLGGKMLTGEFIVDGTIQGIHIDVETIDVSKLARMNELWADVSFLGAAQAELLTVGAIKQDMLNFGTEELVPNGTFMNPEMEELYPLVSPWIWATGPEYRRYGQPHALYAPGSGFTVQTRMYVSSYIPVQPGEKLFLSMEWGVIGSVPNADMLFQVVGYDSMTNPTAVSYGVYIEANRQDAVFTSSGNTTITDGVVTIPDGVSAVRLGLVPTNASAGYAGITGGWIVNKLSTRRVFASTGNTGQSTEISPAGIRLFDDEQNEVISITSTPPNYLIIKGPELTPLDPLNPKYEAVASISQSGNISSRDLNIEHDPIFEGTSLLGDYGEYQHPSGNGALSYLDRLPWGVVARGAQNVQGRQTSNRAELAELGFDVRADRLYTIQIEPIGIYLGRGLYGHLEIHQTMDGSGPTWDDYLVRRIPSRAPNGTTTPDIMMSLGGTIYHYFPSTGYARLLFSMNADSTDGAPMTVFDTINGGVLRVVICDVGPLLQDVLVNRTGTLDAPVPPPPTKKNYTKYYNATSARTYIPDGRPYLDGSGNAINEMYQGSSGYNFSYGSTVGNLESMAIFPNMTSDLSGATITSMRAYFYFEHWWENNGGTADIGFHGHTSLPGSWSSANGVIHSSSWPKPGGRWVNIPSTYWNGFKTGAYRGLTLGPGGYRGNGYGYARGNPRIEIKYTK